MPRHKREEIAAPKPAMIQHFEAQDAAKKAAETYHFAVLNSVHSGGPIHGGLLDDLLRAWQEASILSFKKHIEYILDSATPYKNAA